MLINIESKLRPIYIAKILLERTDEDHVLTTNELIKILEKKYNISAHRTTIGEDIKVLKQVGLDVETIRSTQNRYHILSRTFDIAELKLLIEAVESSMLISDKKSGKLIKKIQEQASIYNAEALKRNLKVYNHFKPDNEDILYIADTINNAINTRRKISFQYYYYNACKKKKLENDGNKYMFSPYYLIWDGDYYYMVGYSDKLKNIVNFRVDRIYKQPTILDKSAEPLPKDFDINAYIKTPFRMYNSECKEVELICENSTIDTILDCFGIDTKIYANDLTSFRIIVYIAISHVFYAWVFGFGGKVKIKAPEEVKEEYTKMICEAADSID